MDPNNTGKECHHCGYHRTSTDKVANDRCPRCGNSYFAAETTHRKKAQHYPEHWHVKSAENPLRIIQNPLLYSLAKFTNYVITIALLLLVLSFWQKGHWPAQEAINKRLFNPMLLETIEEPPYHIEQNYQSITIQPVANMIVLGLVASYNDSESVIWKYKDDDFRVKNICLLWGKNLLPDSYQQFKVKSFKHYCKVEKENTSMKNFHYEDYASIQLLSINPDILTTIEKLNIGDQISLEGTLVNYHIDNTPSGVFKSTLTLPYQTQEQKNYMMLEKINVLESSTPKWHAIYDFSVIFFIFALIFRVSLIVFDLILTNNALNRSKKR